MRDFMNITKALADENRVRVLIFLHHGELCVCQIIEMLKLAPSTVSKHMAILRQAGLVESRKEGRWRHYRLPDNGSPHAVQMAIKWVQESLKDDRTVAKDVERVNAVLKMDKKALCDRYKG